MKAKGKKKHLDFTVRPRAAKEELPPAAEQWVKEGQGASAPQKRLTLNLPAALHASFKSRCAMDGVTIQDRVAVLIEQYLAQGRTPEPRPKTADTGPAASQPPS